MPAKRLLTDADCVWNRACYREGDNLREGDRALSALLLVDGYIQNGGVCHAFDLTSEELIEGLDGYKYFGLDEMAAIIKRHGGGEEAKYNQRYYQFTRPTNQIWARFEEVFRQHPERFASLGPSASG